ncbi:hypothetical protein BURC_02236 [Burkholderiaceae bacterium]|nr:hypothetical protein BURC_02236 [Burkholderiaceae bacterium]
MLASTAAGLQNVAVGEICSVHGVSLPSATQKPDVGEQPGEHGTPSPADDHCALAALAVLAAASEPSLTVGLPSVWSGLLPPDAQEAPRESAWTAAQPRGPPRA